jgi:cytochrome c biogenesis protein CcmG, thiol:disulfide interchange protein DsbE
MGVRAWMVGGVLAVLFFCGAVGAADTIGDLAIDFRMNPLDGQVAPAFTLSALDGKRLSLADFKGQVVLLYFWASW